MNPPTQTNQLQPGAPLAPVPQVAPVPPSHLQTCAACDAPLDALQRYCLNCGSRSRYVSNPAVEYLASKRRPDRLIPKSAAGDDGVLGTSVNKTAVPWLVGSVAIALILGLLIGNSDGGNDKLAAALAAQKPPVVNVNGGGGGATGATATPLTSDFTLDKGYTVQVATIPSTSDQAAADAAKADATSKGAKDVGLINPSDFTLDPAPAGTDYLIFSGQFAKKADAEKALKKLKAKFPDAKVVGVTAAAGGSETSDAAADSTGDVALDKYKPSAKKQADDKKNVEDLNSKTGDDYVKEQENLDPVTVVPGDPNANTDPNALPGGD